MTPARASTLLATFVFSACSQRPSARFGLVNGVQVAETRRVPYTVGTHYGFRLDYHDTGHPVMLREQFDLPGPAHWRSTSPPDQRMSASRGGRTVSERFSWAVERLLRQMFAPSTLRTFRLPLATRKASIPSSSG
jgi:hypothetical protein